MSKKSLGIGIVILLLGTWIVIDKYTQKEEKNHDTKKLEEVTDSVICIFDEHIDHIKYDKSKDSLALDSLNKQLLLAEGNQEEIEKLKNHIFYHENRIRNNVETIEVLPKEIYIPIVEDTIIYNYQYKDTIVYNVIDSTVILSDTIYVKDTSEVQKEHLKKKYR